jgi:hypothetical protein
VPYLAVNHLEGHLLSPFLGMPGIPEHVALLASGTERTNKPEHPAFVIFVSKPLYDGIPMLGEGGDVSVF